MANLDEIVGYTATGASIGSSIPIVGTAVGAGIGATVGTLKGWYDRNKAGKERRRLERLNKIQAKTRNEQIENAILLQNESARLSIDKELETNLKATDTAYAQSGAYRTGGRLKAETNMRNQANEAIIRATGANALAGQQLKQNALQMDRDWDLKIGQLEAAKQTGDVGAIASIAEQLVPALLGKIQGKGKGIDPEDISSEGMEDFLSDTTPELNQPSPLDGLSSNILGIKPRTFAPNPNLNPQTDPIDILYRGGL